MSGLIGKDNVSVMAGINNGVYAELKKDVPLLILIKCACHSLPLAISYTASECFPRIFLIAESQLIFKFKYQTAGAL